MDTTRFDAMARLLGGAANRRTMFKTLAAVVAAGGVAPGMVSAGPTGQPTRAPRTCRYPGYYCARDAHCCSESGCMLTGVPRRQRNRCACVADGEGKCFVDRDCCSYNTPTNGHICETQGDGIGLCKPVQ